MFIFQRCAPASIRLMDNEQFKFGKFCLIIHNIGQPGLEALHIATVIISST